MIRGGREGYDRLQTLARARWPDTADLLARAGVRPGMRCVDLGCGGDARVYPRVLELRGGDAAIRRKLYRHFLDAGIPDPDLRLVQRADVNGEAKTLSLSTLEATADAIVEEGLASIDEVNAALADLAAFTADRATVVGDPRVFQLWCSRPGR